MSQTMLAAVLHCIKDLRVDAKNEAVKVQIDLT